MPLLRSCSPALATALASGQKLWSADLFYLQFASGSNRRYTSWETDLKIVDFTYISAKPWIRRSRWGVTNTMVVPEMTVTFMAQNDAPNMKTLAHNGLFDGATMDMSRLFMPTPGDVTTLGTIDIFFGDVGAVDIIGTEITLRVKGRNNRLDVPAPRNLYQTGCLHTFCDPGCTLSAGSFTATYTVGTSPAPSKTFLPWTSAPGTPADYLSGKLTMLTGTSAGQVRTIVGADATGLTLAYPLYALPVTGDTFSALKGCAKTAAACTGYGNLINFRGFPWIPTPDASGHGAL